MILNNANIFMDGGFRLGSLSVENGVVTAIGDDLGPGEDCGGAFLLPGLVDLHTHGCGGWCFDTVTPEELPAMERFYAKNGTTAVLATVMTGPREQVLSALSTAAGAAGGVVRGSYLEGPFFGPEKRGAHREDCLSPIDEGFFEEILKASRGTLRVAAIDPCLPGALELIQKYRDRVRFSLAHTPADYETALRGFAAGATQVTHLFNAMTGLHHRQPGLVGAALAGDCFAEVICDGIHVHPAVLKTAFAALGSRGLIISDSLAPCGRGDGESVSGGQPVFVRGKEARLADGTIAGSVTFPWEGMRTLVRAGVPLEQAVSAATAVPARAAGLDGICGAIASGRRADLCLAGPDLTLRRVWLAGEEVR